MISYACFLIRLCVEMARTTRRKKAKENKLIVNATEGILGRGLLLVAHALLKSTIYKIMKTRYHRYLKPSHQHRIVLLY